MSSSYIGVSLKIPKLIQLCIGIRLSCKLNLLYILYLLSNFRDVEMTNSSQMTTSLKLNICIEKRSKQKLKIT